MIIHDAYNAFAPGGRPRGRCIASCACAPDGPHVVVASARRGIELYAGRGASGARGLAGSRVAAAALPQPLRLHSRPLGLLQPLRHRLPILFLLAGIFWLLPHWL